MIRLFFLIRSLDFGGAERQLIELVKGLDKKLFAITVATFYEGGALRAEIERIEDVRVISLNKKGRWDLFHFLFRLWSTIRKIKPHIIYSYMNVANELSFVMGKAMGAKVVWGLRSSYVDFGRYDWATNRAFRIGAWLSQFANLIIVNSYAGIQYHTASGYSGMHMVVIPNGIDTERYFPDRAIGRGIRAQWGVGKDEILIGLVGRLDPMKDHQTFLRAAALLSKKRSDVRFVCVGDGLRPYVLQLRALGETLGLKERIIWAGELNDMVAVYNALDIAAMCSIGEGFSNVIGEAMACGMPCVVTNVGDSARIVGDAGVVVPPGDPESLCQGLEICIARVGSSEIRQKARQRIVQEFSRTRMVSLTAKALLDLL